MREACVGMQRTKFGKKRDPLKDCRVFGKCALEPPERFFFFAKRDVSCRDQGRRNVSLLPFLQKLRKKISRLHLPVHPSVGDGKSATREMRCLLGFGVESDRFRKIALL